ncbi:hypothetical protein JTE90_015206 [Oedothorax gibbosus]|uniref:Uncharacterized protein n=1 Tax=Oedothorax gibbosus TaxID=931172 RepID=A0AAV6V8Q9_9ARAC|nr:hypothetical protein JTE90_015206 [Oedothorax gibbosus]
MLRLGDPPGAGWHQRSGLTGMLRLGDPRWSWLASEMARDFGGHYASAEGFLWHLGVLRNSRQPDHVMENFSDFTRWASYGSDPIMNI